MLKSHSCAELGPDLVGERVTLAGWVDRRRDHGGVTFIDLRDRSGIAQIVANPEQAAAAHAAAADVRSEWVIQIEGLVRLRPEGMLNPDLPTGEVEVAADRAQSSQDTALPDQRRDGGRGDAAIEVPLP